jgi:hypothetical protein
VESWELSRGSWSWLYGAVIALLWLAVVTLLDTPWYLALLFAGSVVEVGFRVAEWGRRRRLRSQPEA